jgi:ribosomal protein L35AE/L33A
MTDAKNKLAGSPENREPAFLAIGKVRRPHGVRGEVVAEIYTDFPEKIIPKTTIFLGEKHSKFTIKSSRQHNEGLIIGFEGVNSPEEAGRFRNWKRRNSLKMGIIFTTSLDLQLKMKRVNPLDHWLRSWRLGRTMCMS